MKDFTEIIENDISIAILKETHTIEEIENLESLSFDDLRDGNYDTRDTDDGEFYYKYLITTEDDYEYIVEFDNFNEILDDATDVDHFLELLEEYDNEDNDEE